jgi:SAM-dependent methyltransferase
MVAFLRSGKPSQYQKGDLSDAYLTAHTREYFKELWTYGYPRVFNLLSHFSPTMDPASLRVLSLGPRSEIELYHLWLFFGFSWKNIVGADLVSFSEKIKLADMSVQLPFEDNAFDVIVASHCLEKSRSPERTRDEIMRVAKPNARVLVCGNRLHDGALTYGESSIPRRFFDEGVYGLIGTYGLGLKDIEYMNARSPHGFEIIFRVTK